MIGITFTEALDWLAYAVSLSAIPGWLFTLWRRHLHRKTIRSFFGGRSLSIYLPLRDLSNRVVVDEADFLAAVELRRFLTESGIDAEFRFVDTDGEVDLTAPGLVVICGPKMSSAVSAAILSDEQLAFEERGDSWHIREKTGNLLYRSPMDSGEGDGDVAYLARTVRRPGLTRTFISVAGIHAPGSAGAVHYLCNHKRLRRLHRRTKDKLFSAVIESDILRRPLRVTHSQLLSLKVGTAPQATPRSGVVSESEAQANEG